MTQLKQILENQKEVQYLAYFVIQDDRTDRIELNLYTSGIAKKYFFQDESICLNKIIDILYELKRLERWTLARQEKSNAKPR